VRLRQQLLEPVVLRLKVAKPGGIRYLHPAKPTAPSIKGRIRKPMLATQFLNRAGASLGFLQKPDDLLIPKPLLYVRPLL